MIAVEPHPLLDLAAVVAHWPAALGELGPTSWIAPLTDPAAESPFLPPSSDGWDAERRRVRDLLRHGGFKPAGRSKPCSEYMRAAASNGVFPRINVAVDLTNVAVLHGRLPISTVDLDLTAPPLRVGLAPIGARYVFNASGQTIDVSGLLCLFDAEGACSNAVKDSQRTKTTASSTTTLTLIWGTKALPERTERVLAYFEGLVQRAGATTERVTLRGVAGSPGSITADLSAS
ncbi:MAG: hypothetical protein EA397_00980 [Deltaproteobacteria bacterium]|nr:MAG: hypothetical protein EA397_00980 [Deltaproteobacteria bacterium]